MTQKIQIRSVFFFVCILFGFLYFQSEGIEGGQDSWQHFLISKYAIKYPDLLLDQWNKPVFTWLTFLVCQLGMNALIVFNMLCVLISGLLISHALKKRNIENSFLAIPFLCFCPIMLGNTVSCLTEPLNVLILSLVFYLWLTKNFKIAVMVASFLPFVRTEGFVICGALLIILLFQKKYYLLLWLFLGSIILNIAGFGITGKPFWIITENPYLKFEQEGQFDPGSGSLLYYVNQARSLFGLPLLILLLLGNILWLISFRLRKLKEKMIEIDMVLIVFWFYFTAHTLIYYFGILGSHGLVRVMAVVAPCVAITAVYSLNFLLTRLPNFSLRKRFMPYMLTLMVILIGYKENSYAKPYQPFSPTVKKDITLTNFEKAAEWLESSHLMSRTIIHQLPAFNVLLNKDPYNPKSSYYIWSINKPDDWAEKGVIVVWDGFYSTREGNMPLNWLMSNPNYKLIHSIEGFERPKEYPTIYDIRIFEKVNK